MIDSSRLARLPVASVDRRIHDMAMVIRRDEFAAKAKKRTGSVDHIRRTTF